MLLLVVALILAATVFRVSECELFVAPFAQNSAPIQASIHGDLSSTELSNAALSLFSIALVASIANLFVQPPLRLPLDVTRCDAMTRRPHLSTGKHSVSSRV